MIASVSACPSAAANDAGHLPSRSVSTDSVGSYSNLTRSRPGRWNGV